MDDKEAVRILARTIADDPGSLGGYHKQEVAHDVARAMTHALGTPWVFEKDTSTGKWYVIEDDTPHEQT